MITTVKKVVVPVDDQEAAKRFWVENLGFTLVTDAPFGNGDRWLEVETPDGRVAMILSQRPADQPRYAESDALPHSDVFFGCADMKTTHRELTTRGVRFHTPPTEMPFGWWAMFEDPDGTRYALVEQP